MANWMIDASRLDDQQLEVLELPSNEQKIIKGCAGSGKTVLAVHKADRIRKKQQGSFYILVYTRALRAFIKMVLMNWAFQMQMFCMNGNGEKKVAQK